MSVILASWDELSIVPSLSISWAILKRVGVSSSLRSGRIQQ
jgi:hypothetical protein